MTFGERGVVEEEGQDVTEHAASALWKHGPVRELRAHAADFPGAADVAVVVDGGGSKGAGVFARVDVAKVPDAGAPFVDCDGEEGGLEGGDEEVKEGGGGHCWMMVLVLFGRRGSG